VDTAVPFTLTPLDSAFRGAVSSDEMNGWLFSASTVYRTVDGGVNWEVDTANWQNWGSSAPYESIKEILTTSGRTIYFLGIGNLWYTTDGNAIQYTDPGHQFTSLQVNPADATKLVGTWLNDDQVTFDVVLSENNGVNWQVIYPAVSYDIDVAWTEDGANLLLLTSDLELIISDNYFLSHRTLYTGAYAFIYADGNNIIIETADSLLGSSDLGLTWANITLGVEDPDSYSFYLISVDSGDVWFGGNPYTDPNTINLFTSDSFAGWFQSSMPNAVYSPFGYFEVPGAPGLKIATNYTDDSFTYVSSWLSVNAGTTWTPLALDSTCTNSSCHLNLFVDDRYGVVLTRADAPGVILSQGTQGPRAEGANINMFLTTDGGKTWVQTATGGASVVLGEYGEILYTYSTSDVTFQYTRDYSTWIPCTPDYDVSIESIEYLQGISDIGKLGGDGNSLWFIVQVVQNSMLYDAIVHFDLTDVTIPDCLSTDFEEWNPYGTDCYLGQTAAVYRKVPGTVCHVDPTVLVDSIGNTNHTTCDCTNNDYYCEVCWVPDPLQSQLQCILDVTNPNCPSYDPTVPPANCTANSTYVGAPAYRKNAASVCVDSNGLDATLLANRTVMCPNVTTPTPSPQPAPTPTPTPIPSPEPVTNEPTVDYPSPPPSDNNDDTVRIVVGLIVASVGVAVVGFIVFYAIGKYPSYFPGWLAGPSTQAPPAAQETHQDNHQQSLDTISEQ